MSVTIVARTGWRALTEEERSLLREAVRRVFQAIKDRRLPDLDLPERLEPRTSLTEELVHHIAQRLELQESTAPNNRFIQFVIEGMSLRVDRLVRSVRGTENLTFVQVAVLLFLTLKDYSFVLPELRLNVYLRGGEIYRLPQ